MTTINQFLIRKKLTNNLNIPWYAIFKNIQNYLFHFINIISNKKIPEILTNHTFTRILYRNSINIPYNQISNRAWENFGDLNEGEIDIILKHSENVDIDDKLVVDSTDYKVIRKEKYPYDNDNLAILVRVARILD